MQLSDATVEAESVTSLSLDGQVIICLQREGKTARPSLHWRLTPFMQLNSSRVSWTRDVLRGCCPGVLPSDIQLEGRLALG